jgi:hypothetical protein
MSAGPDDRRVGSIVGRLSSGAVGAGVYAPWGTGRRRPNRPPMRLGCAGLRTSAARWRFSAFRIRSLTMSLISGYAIWFKFGLLSPGRWTAGLMAEECPAADRTNADAGGVREWTKGVTRIRHSSRRSPGRARACRHCYPWRTKRPTRQPDSAAEDRAAVVRYRGRIGAPRDRSRDTRNRQQPGRGRLLVTAGERRGGRADAATDDLSLQRRIRPWEAPRACARPPTARPGSGMRDRACRGCSRRTFARCAR